jgi:hypothetical protein
LLFYISTKNWHFFFIFPNNTMSSTYADTCNCF